MSTHPARSSVGSRRAAIYVRVSRLPDDEIDTKVSPDMQTQACRRLVEGYEIEVFSDLNMSGKNTDRPRYQEMLRRVDAGEFDVVVAYELSRITRDGGDHAEFFKRLARKKVRFMSASEPIDPSTAEGRFQATILTGSNQLQREQTQRRVKDSFARKVERGELVGRLPAGYRRRKEVISDNHVKTTIEVDPEASAIVALLFSQYKTGSHSFKSLALWMNEYGYAVVRSIDIKRPWAANALWNADKVKTILSNERYSGRLPRMTGRSSMHRSPPSSIGRPGTRSCA